MPATIQDRLEKILTSAYHYEQISGRSRYLELKPKAETKHLLKANNKTYRILLGSSGAFRYTFSSIAASHPFPEKLKARLLSESETGGIETAKI